MEAPAITTCWWPTPPEPPTPAGTISGQLQTPGNGAAVVGRTVTAINNADGQRFEARSNNTGGFTLRIPPASYRIEVEQRPGEANDEREALRPQRQPDYANKKARATAENDRCGVAPSPPRREDTDRELRRWREPVEAVDGRAERRRD